MKRRNRAQWMWRWTARPAVVAAAWLSAAPRVFGQGCAMCYADAAAQGPRARQSLDLAILTLLVPSVLLFAGVLIAAFRRRERDLARDSQVAQARTRTKIGMPPAGRRIASNPNSP